MLRQRQKLFDSIEQNREIWLSAGTAVTFGLAVYIAISISRNVTNIAAIWPANGILLASLLCCADTRTRLVRVALCYCANVMAGLLYGDGYASTISFALINSIEVLVARYLIQEWIGDNLDFGSWRTISRFLLICGAAAPAGPAVVGASIAGLLFGSPLIDGFITWFASDSLGLLIVTPAVFLSLNRKSTQIAHPSLKSRFEQFALLAASLVLVFGQSKAPLLFLIVPAMVSVSFRLGPRCAAHASLLVTVVSIASAYAGVGPTALIDPHFISYKIWSIQLFCLVNLLTSLAVAAALHERDRLRTQFEKASASESAARQMLQVALDHMPHGVCMFDVDGRMTMRNHQFLNIYQLEARDVPVGLTFGDLAKLCEDRGIVPQASAANSDLTLQGDFDQKLSDGRSIRIAQKSVADHGVVCAYIDISDEKRSEQQLRHIALHDALTNLPNRRVLAAKFDELLARPLSDSRFAVVLIDVDNFKSINDTYGHAVGDEVLKTVADRLQKCVRHNDLVARVGGDEFAILIVGYQKGFRLNIVAQRILAGMRKGIRVNGKSIPISVSIGIAQMPQDGSTRDGLLKAADTALYKAKQSGRDTFAEYGDDCIPERVAS